MQVIAIVRIIAMAAGLWLGGVGAAQACIGLGCNCGVSTQDVAFGVYGPLSSSPKDAVGRVTVTCGALVAVLFSYDIKLSAGAGGAYASRRMSAGANLLGYQLYTDAGRTSVWGDGTAGTSIVSKLYPVSVLLQTDNFSVYGRIPAAQNVKPGDYTDTILVTVIF